MERKTVAVPLRGIVLPSLDRGAAERVAKWVGEWHSADYDPEEISSTLANLPPEVPVDDLLEPFDIVAEEESAQALAELALALIHYVERGCLQAAEARDVFRMACLQLCNRGIPFEETAKGDDLAQWFHYIGVNEFGDTDDSGFSTDLTDLRLLSRYFLDPERLAEELFDKPHAEFPTNYHEGYIGIAGALGDWRAAPFLLRILSRCEDSPSVATTIAALGMLGRARKGWSAAYRDRVAQVLKGYAFSDAPEVATSAVLALEGLGGIHAEATLRELERVLPAGRDMLSAHVSHALIHLEKGDEALEKELARIASDPKEPQITRICAIERMAGSDESETICTLADLLDDPAVEPVRVDGYLTDDVVHVIREAAFMSIMDCRFRRLAEVLGEPVLDRIEKFQTSYPPSWWIRARIGNREFEEDE